MRELPKPLMLSVALLQGLLLYALYDAFGSKTWPSESPLWSYPLWTLALGVPLLLLLSLTQKNVARVMRSVVILGVVFALLAAYIGFQTTPQESVRSSSLTSTFIVSMTLAAFKVLMYLQQRADQVALTYPALFKYSWRNFLVAIMSGFFLISFGGVLLLWAQLFELIEIDFFKKLFRQEWFIFPVLSLAYGIGVIIFRNLTNVIDSITALLHWFFKLLLPLVVVVGALFVFALPFVGLDVLWSTGKGTALLLWLLAITLFITNAVYQDGRETNPYPAIVHRLIYVGLCTLPVISALSLYGLVQRLSQYGWTVGRCWAFATWLILSLFSIGYFIGIVRRRSLWPHELGRVNTIMGVVVLAVMLLANSPVLDFRKISLASQLDRVESAEMELEDFDFGYAHRALARPGYLAIEEMKRNIVDSHPELLKVLENPENQGYGATPIEKREAWKSLQYRPQRFDLPVGLKTVIEKDLEYYAGWESTLFQIDLNEDSEDEYVLIFASPAGFRSPKFYYQLDDRWETGDMDADAFSGVDNIRNGPILLQEPRFKSLKIGEMLLTPRN